MATTLRKLDLRMKTLMEAWDFKNYGKIVQGMLGRAGPGIPHIGERGNWTSVEIPSMEGGEPIGVKMENTPENREIYNNFIHAYNNKIPDSSPNGGMFYWFAKFADIVPTGESLRSIYVRVFGKDTPNPTAQSAVAVSPNIFRQEDQNQKIELGDRIYRRESQDNEENMYGRSNVLLAPNSPLTEDTDPDNPKTLYRAYFGNGPSPESQREKGNASPNGYRQNDTREQFAENNQYDETKGRKANIIEQVTGNLLDWLGFDSLSEEFREKNAINKNLLNRWYSSGAGSRLRGGTALKGGELLHIGFWDTLFPPKSIKDANRNHTSELVSDPLSEINFYKWGNDYLLRFYNAMGAGEIAQGESGANTSKVNSFVDPPSETDIISQSKAGFNAGQIKPYDGDKVIWNKDKLAGENGRSEFGSFLSTITSIAGRDIGFNTASSSLADLGAELDRIKTQIYSTFAPGYKRIPIPFVVKTNLNQLLNQNLLTPEDLAPGRREAIAAAAADNSITNSDVFSQLYINNVSAINNDENPAGSIAGIPLSELQAPANTGKDADDGTLQKRRDYVYSFSEDTLRANTFTKQRGFQDNIAGNVLEEFETSSRGGVPTLKANESSIKGVLPAVENDPDEFDTGDKTTLLKTLSKGDTQFFPCMFETVNKGGEGPAYKEFKQYAYFQAAIQSISESFAPAWSSKHFFGRTEQVQSYTFTERTFDIQFVIFAPEIRRLQNLYERVSWLAQQTYASYDDAGRMKSGPIIRMTIGDMFSNLTGFIRSLSYDWNYLGPGGKWEISQGLRIPMACSVSMNFTVMHDDMPNRNYNFYPGPLLHPLGLISSRGGDGTRTSGPIIPTKEGVEAFRPVPADLRDITFEELQDRGLEGMQEDVTRSNLDAIETRKMPYIAQLKYNTSLGTAGTTVRVKHGTAANATFDDIIF